MANPAGMPHPPAKVVDIVEEGDEPQAAEEGDGQPLIEVDAPNSPPVEDAEVAATLTIPILNTHVGESSGVGLNLGETHIGEGSGVGLNLGETHIGESSGVGLNLDLNLGVGQPKKSLISRTSGPVFVKKL